MSHKFTLISLIALVSVVLIGWIMFNKPLTQDTYTTPDVATTTPTTTPTTSVYLYYYSPQADMDQMGNIKCSQDGVTPVAREIKSSDRLINDTLELLLSGDITQEERLRGITTDFPLTDLMLVGIDVTDGVARVALDDPSDQTRGGACRANVLRVQVEQTIMQFPSVAEVRFIPETLFQP